MLKDYQKPELNIHGDLKDITKAANPKGIDGSDMNGGAS
jgi:hypothetical protein